MNYEGEKFILKLYTELYKDDLVKRSGTKSDNKYELVRKYFERLANTEKVFDGNHPKTLTFLKELYYDKYIIKEIDIPESYYESQKRMALERGYGYIEYTGSVRHRLANQIIEEQKRSLDKWLNYLMKENTVYPMWARYWAFQGMLKIGYYDKIKKEFRKRSKGTIKPFIDLNKEALALTIDLVTNYEQIKQLNDKELESLIENGSFEKLYLYNIKKIYESERNNKDKSNSLEGVWIKYNDGDAKKLVESLEGKGTGWCIASLTIAKSYLELGSMHIFYTKDSRGNYTKPRVCIRQKYNAIAEVRGIEKNQNLEEEMLKITEKKLDEFPDKEKYHKKVKDMEKLTELYNKVKNNGELTNQEIRFLYEIDCPIDGFGFEKDPRIDEVKKLCPITDKEVMLEAININKATLEDASRKLRKDKEVVLAAVKKNGKDLMHASKELQNNKEIVLEAVKENGGSLEYASPDLKSEKEIVLLAVQDNGYALKYANEELRKDKDVVLSAVKSNGRALEYTSKKLQSEKEIVLEAVSNDGFALSFANNNLKKDKEVVLEAVRRSYIAITYADSELVRNDKEIMLEIIRRNWRAIEYASPDLKKDKEIIKALLDSNEYALNSIKKEKHTKRKVKK